MPSEVKTEGPELALMNKFMYDICSTNIEVGSAIAILANVFTGIMIISNSPIEPALKLFAETCFARMQMERALLEECHTDMNVQ